ncbi:MAG: NYN domain-containing protein [Planctomycetes bacterium]|nr:NYN domain-containing protein [Planctomycetota bacterium]
MTTHASSEPRVDRKIAVFIDMDNVVLGARDAKFQKFEIGLVLDRLVEKGDLVVKRAYADWNNHPNYKRGMHEAAIELIDIPESRMTGKNSADIKMVVDALELAFTKPHIDTFALVSGDSDFSPLVSKLRENDKHIIGIGVKNSSSRLLIDNCDEFVLYDDLARATSRRRAPVRGAKDLPKVKQEAFALLMETLAALQREGKDTIQGSLVKDTIKRKQPQFNEEYHGYNSFGRLLEDAQRHGLIKLRKDARSGTWVIDEVLEDAG